MDSKLKLTIDWHEIYAAIEESGYVVFPKDVLQKFAEERKEWEINKKMMDSWMASRAEQEAGLKRLSNLNADEIEIIYRAFVYADTHWDEDDKEGTFQSLFSELKETIMEASK